MLDKLRWVWVGTVLLLAGCATTPDTQFYSLSSGSAGPGGQSASTGELSLRIGPFEFPSYLQRPNIVTRSADNLIEVAEFHRWAGSLEDEFHQALGSNLGVLLKTRRISVFPSEMRFEPAYYLTGEVVRFDGRLGGSLTLDVRWTINRTPAEDALVVAHTVLSEPVEGAGYADLVAAYDRILLDLGKAVQARLEALVRERS